MVWLASVLAFVAGACVVALIVIYLARRSMVVEHESKWGFDETVERMRKVITETEGWAFPFQEWRFSEAMIKHGKPFSSVDKLTVFFTCHPGYAQRMVNAGLHMAAIMPCGWAVYERGGKTYLSDMNIGLMAIPFGRAFKRIFRLVAHDEKLMLPRVLEKAGLREAESPEGETA